jgi:hypothetical protein
MLAAAEIRVCSVVDTDVEIQNSKAAGDAVLAVVAVKSKPAHAKRTCAAPDNCRLVNFCLIR